MSSSGTDIADRLVLATSAYWHFPAGHPLALEAIANAAVVRTLENGSALRDLLSEPFVTVADATRSVAERDGRVLADLRGAGTPIPTNGIWIAVTALAVGAHLLTFDADFRHVARPSTTILTPA